MSQKFHTLRISPIDHRIAESIPLILLEHGQVTVENLRQLFPRQGIAILMLRIETDLFN